jgi:hypothetical protein
MTKALTKAHIYKLNKIKRTFFLNKIISGNEILERNEYVLMIHSTSADCLKIHIYPLDNPNKVYKISVSIQKNNKQKFNTIIKKLKNFKIIHTSGLTMSKDIFYEEFYITSNLLIKNDKLYDDLTTISHNISISIEKI